MVNGYVTLPSKLIDEVNKNSNFPITINDKEIVSQMKSIVRLGKPVYFRGVRFEDGLVDSQMLTVRDGESWAFSFLANDDVPKVFAVFGDLNDDYFMVERSE